MTSGLTALATGLFISAVSSADDLAKVQSGWSAKTGIPAHYLWILFGGLAFISLLGGLSYYFNARRRRRLLKSWTSIVEPRHISAILRRAEQRQASHTLEIFSENHAKLYRGHLEGLVEGRALILSLSENPSPDADFKKKPIQVHLTYRPSPSLPTEHYQFNSQTIDIDFVREKGWRTALVHVAWPRSLVSAQRRNYIRIEPRGALALKCRVKVADVAGSPHTDDSPDSFLSGDVLDISIGGAQIFFSHLAQFNKDERILGVFDLPSEGLDLKLEQKRLRIHMELLSQDLIAGGHGGGERHTCIRVRFVGEFVADPQRAGHWIYKKASSESFQNLAYWLQACQRLEIQKDNGLLPPSRLERPANRFPSQPPERPKKAYDDEERNA